MFYARKMFQTSWDSVTGVRTLEAVDCLKTPEAMMGQG